MAYNQALAARLQPLLGANLEAKKMFGGVGYLLDGNMACGVQGNDVILRLGTEDAAKLLQMPFARVFDMTGRPMKGWVVVDAAVADDELVYWIEKSIAFAASLPSK